MACGNKKPVKMYPNQRTIEDIAACPHREPKVLGAVSMGKG